jgi:P27 family predicted phage terminase small subunit
VPQPRKDPARRQNRVTTDLVVVGSGVSLPVPAPDEAWRADTVGRWGDFWGSKIAAQVEPSDVGSLRRLFYLYDELDRMKDAIELTGRVVEGSQGQPRPNPLYSQVEKFAAECRQLEDRFGLSPVARLKMGVVFADAHSSLDALNSQIAGTVDVDVWDDASEA